jgi:hypothetical protein
MRSNPGNLDIYTMSNSVFLYAQIAIESNVNLIDSGGLVYVKYCSTMA